MGSQSPGVVCFDFDSTLIDCESLDEMLAELLADRPDEARHVRAITDDGMEGRVDFCNSLERRLAIARPMLPQVEAFAQRAVDHLTPGLEDLIAGLRAEVWIVSGGLQEVLYPVAERLGVARERVLGTQVRWAPDGSMASVLCMNKPVRVAEAAGSWASPSVAVGDGMSDHALLAAGLVDEFVAFTGHVRREAVVKTGCTEARTVSELEYALRRFA